MVKILTQSNKVNDKLKAIKSNIKGWSEYFRDNFKRFATSRRFTFESSLNERDLAILQETNKPQIEFNIQEAFLSRLRGEFSKQEPTLNIIPKSTATSIPNAEVIEFLERYIHQIIFNSNRDNLQYDVLTDILSGGFSVVKVISEYAGAYSFEQEFRFERFFDPTLSIFDKMARLSHKGDGKFSAELFPKTMDEFTDEYGSDAAKKMKFLPTSGAFSGFNWSYSSSDGDKIVLVADYYEKKVRKEKIVQIAPTVFSPITVMTAKEYERMAEEWEQTRIDQVPIVISSRTTEIETIDRYVLCGETILEHEQTNWSYLPHVFIDGNSLLMRKETGGTSYQLTRPFLYQTEGIQRLKNFSGQCLGNALENIVQHKFMYPIEGIPAQYANSITDIQKGAILLYNAFDPDLPDRQLPPPMPVPQSPIHPEILQTFSMADQMMQTILGSYDAALGINNNQLSGTAIRNGAIQSNPVALPFIVSYMKGMAHIGQILLDIIPKTIRTPRTVPIIDKEGKRKFVKLNQEGGITLEYDADALDVNIEPGVSFELQRQMAFAMITQLMQISPEVAEFIGTTSAGLETLLDNIDIRGIERLKDNVRQFLEEKKQKIQMVEQMQQQQAQQQLQMQQAQLQILSKPMEIKEQEVQLKAMKDMKEIEIKQEKVDIDMMKAVAEIGSREIQDELKAADIQARNIRSQVDLERSERDHHHKKAIEILAIHDARESRNPNPIIEVEES